MAKEKRLTPKERKRIRELADAEGAAEKRARLLARPVDDTRQPRIQTAPQSGKEARATEDPLSIYARPMEYCDLKSDREGTWSWGQNRNWPDADWNDTIKPALEELSKLTWSEILAQVTGGDRKRRKKHHDMEISTIAAEASKRWAERGLDLYDTAFRFRLGNKPRLWGFRTAAKFNIVWWDPDHKIYPVEPN